jgi:hypothetical protein
VELLRSRKPQPNSSPPEEVELTRSRKPQLNSSPPEERASAESLRGELSQPFDSHSPDERTSASMHSERLREATAQRDELREGRRHLPIKTPPDERAPASMLASEELPPDLAETRIADADRKGEPPTDERASAFMYGGSVQD